MQTTTIRTEDALPSTTSAGGEVEHRTQATPVAAPVELTPAEIRGAIIAQAKHTLEDWMERISPFESKRLELPVLNGFTATFRLDGETSAGEVTVMLAEPRTPICRVFRQYGTYASGWAKDEAAAAADAAVAGKLHLVLAAIQQ